MWRRLSRESLHLATRLCRGSPKRDEGKNNSEVGSRDPILHCMIVYGALFAGPERPDRGLELSTTQLVIVHRGVLGGLDQFGNTSEATLGKILRPQAT
jgi:hypothetical protein